MSCGTVVHRLQIVWPTVTALKPQQLLFSSWRAVLVAGGAVGLCPKLGDLFTALVSGAGALPISDIAVLESN